MAESITPFLNELDAFFTELQGNPIRKILMKIWFPNWNQLKFRRTGDLNHSQKRIERLKQKFPEYDTFERHFFDDLFFFLNQMKYISNLEWDGIIPQNLNLVYLLPGNLRNFEDHIKDNDYRDFLKMEILNIFLRLTNYKSDAIIPIIDLIDVNKFNFDDGFKFEWFNDITACMFTLYAAGLHFPSPYYPRLNAVQVVSDLSFKLIELDRAFQAWGTSGKKKET